jgi:hypothetical protein
VRSEPAWRRSLARPRRQPPRLEGRPELELLADIAALRARQQELAIQPRTLVEELWCLELHLRLERLAEERGVALLLMGGQAAVMRLEMYEQRGSADNDYVTTASEREITELVEALCAELRQLSSARGLFVPRRLGMNAERRLPLITYALPVFNPFEPERPAEVKLEFHLEPVLPDEEEIEATPFATGNRMRFRLPLLGYQIAFKLMTLAPLPIGLERSREASLPRQAWDLDKLFAQTAGEDWQILEGLVTARLERECQIHRTNLDLEALIQGIRERLHHWLEIVETETAEEWRLIQAFQSTQLFRGTPRPAPQWAARFGRLIVLVRLILEEEAYNLWQLLLTVERSLPERLSALEARRDRAGGTRPPREQFWIDAANAGDLRAFVEEGRP